MKCPACRNPVDPDFHAVCPECGTSIRPDVLEPVPAVGASIPGDDGAGAGLRGAGLPEPPPLRAPGKRRPSLSPLGLVIRIGLVVAIVFGGSIWGWLTSARRDASGAVTSAGHMSVFELRSGDCAELPQLSEDVIAVDKVKVTPCSSPHDIEVFGLTTLSAAGGEPFPGDDAAWVESMMNCLPLYEDFTGAAFDPDSPYDLLTLYPSEESWSKMDDRGAVCMVYRIDGTKLTASLRSAF